MNILNHFVFLEQSRNIDTAIQSHYSTSLVLLSIFLAIFSSYIAFLVSRRIHSSNQKKYSQYWLWAGAFALGSGIWAMHFIGMLAYIIPITVNYDATITVVSIIPAILSSFIVLNTIDEKQITTQSIYWRSILLGIGIGLMHYIGMAAMSMNGVMRYDPWIFIASIFIAIVLANIALQYKLKADKQTTVHIIFSINLLIPAVIMGCAISAMHYVGMAAMYVFPDTNHHVLISAWSSTDLVKIITVISLLLSLLLLISIEVSNRFDLFRKIHESEQDLVITLNSIGDAVITTDKNGLVMRMNPTAEKLTGWSLKESKGKPLNNIFSIVNAATREPVINPVDIVLSKGETVFLNDHPILIAKDGSEFHIADSAAPIRNGDDEIKGMVLVFNDVTDQYQMREDIRLSEQHLKLYREQAPLAAIEWNLDFQVIGWNNAAEKMFGYTLEEVKGKDFVEIMLPKNAIVNVKQIWEDLISQIGGIASTNENITKEGRIIYCEWHNTPLKDESGKVIGAASIVQNITERKQQEEKLRRSLRMDAMGKLTGGIAHDYNNMLGVILGYSELLKDTLSDQPELIDYINEIHHAGERGANLTKKLLTFARKKTADAEAMDINSLLIDQQHMLEKTLTVRIKLTLNLMENLWPVYLDINDLEDAIINMSINAMHAIEGNGRITIQTRNEVVNETDSHAKQIKAGEYVLLSITDTGSGMDQTTKEKMFDPFFSTKGEKGTGLGLSQVYGFIEHNNGSIQVYSELNHGTRLALYFPRHIEISSEEEQGNKEQSVSFKGSETILVVDDEPALVKLSSTILSSQGYLVLSANNGKQALKLLKTESVNLVLSDVIMPEMDGYELAACIQEKYPDIKIQLASGFSDDRHVNMIDESLHDKILHKPYHSHILLKRIRDLLDDK